MVTATRGAEEAWLYNEDAFYFCFYYIHRFCFNFCSYNKIFRIPPSPLPKESTEKGACFWKNK